MEQRDTESLIRRRRAANLGSIIWGVGPTTYLAGLILGLPGKDLWLLLGMQCLVALVPYRLLLALPLQRRLMRRAMEHRSGEPPGHRLARLLELPQSLHLLHLGLLTLVQGVACVGYCLYFERPLWLALPCFAVQELLMAFMLLTHLHWVEQALHPHAVEELHRAPSARAPRRALLWRRLSWQLPYTLGLTLACAVVVPAIVVWRRGSDAVETLAAELAGRGVPQTGALLQRQLDWLRGESAPVLWLGLFLGGLGVLCTWGVASRLAQGTRHLQRSLEQAAGGTYEPPRWFSTDELGRLTIATTRALLRLGGLRRRLHGSARQLQHSAAELGVQQAQQLEALKRQVAALERARMLAHALLADSESSVHEAEALLGLASSAEATHQSGRAAIQQGLAGLSTLHAEAQGLAARIHSLRRSAERLSQLTGLVRDLANQSHMMAHNASIEVAATGAEGTDFARVASQAHALARQSMHSTHEVRSHLQSMLKALQEAVKTTQAGDASVAKGVQQVQASGEALRQLADAAEESASAVRQIVQVLGRQNEDISRLSRAVAHLSHAAAETVRRLETAVSVTRRVDEVARRVHATAGQKEHAEPTSSPARAGREPLRMMRALLREQQFALWVWLVPGACLTWQLLRLTSEEAWDVAWTVVAPLCLVFGVLVPLLPGRALVASALKPPAGTSLEQQLRRILELPRRLGVVQTLTLAGMGLGVSILCGVRYERGLLPTLVCAALLLLLAALASVLPMLRLEDTVRPLALELFHRHPEVELPWRGPFWRSLSWYLPYLMGLTTLCVLLSMASLLWRLGGEAAWRLVEELALHGHAVEAVVYPRLGALGVESAWAMALPGALLLWHAFRIAQAMAHQLGQGTRELEDSLASIADGPPRLPRWVSTNELGSLSLATAAIFHPLWTLAREEEVSNGQLDEAAQELAIAQQQQADDLARQSDLVSEALATVSEVEQASRLAAQRAEELFVTAKRGEAFRQAGEEALAQALHGMQALRAHVADMAKGLVPLEEHARQLGAITALVRELARECDTVALNASIQAVRTGEQGRVFAVIARELRTLAERFSQNTQEAELLLRGFRYSAQEVATAVRERAEGPWVGQEQAQHSAKELSQLSRLLEKYRTGAWRIAQDIREQNLDISEVSREVGRVAGTAEELTKGLEVSARLTATVGRMEVPGRAG
jgi:methyl-accepting chemotaxis protein